MRSIEVYLLRLESRFKRNNFSFQTASHMKLNSKEDVRRLIKIFKIVESKKFHQTQGFEQNPNHASTYQREETKNRKREA